MLKTTWHRKSLTALAGTLALAGIVIVLHLVMCLVRRPANWHGNQAQQQDHNRLDQGARFPADPG